MATMQAPAQGNGATSPGVMGTYSDLQGKRVMVTGGSSGLGKCIALAFARSGATVAVASRTKDKLQKVVEQMGGGHAVVLDQMDMRSCDAAVSEAVQALGGLDILVNVGGMNTNDEPNTVASFISHFQLHVASAVALIQAALPQLIANKGAVVSITSTLAIIPHLPGPEYTVAKAALDSLTRVYALKYARDGVRFNALRTGFTITEGTQALATRTGSDYEDMVKDRATVHALGRVSRPEEQAAAALFLCSSASSFITGECMDTDGGAQLGYWFNASDAGGARPPPHK